VTNIENRNSEIKAGNITFLVSSYFKEDTGETIDKMIIKLICENSENMITKPNN